MMKPDLKVEKMENLGRDGISIMDAQNKKGVDSESVGGERGEDDEGDGNYETSPESTDAPIPYEEILNEDELQKLMAEFNRLKSSCYLDHAGATLYSASQLDSYFSELQSSLYSNPHSRNPSSTITGDAVDHVRNMVLRHFGTNSDDYTVIFTSGATAGLKLVAESFQFNGGLFAYLEESHTSVVGMREVVNRTFLDQLPGNADQTKVRSLSKSTMTKLMDPNFYCGKWQSSSPCQKQCDEPHGASCWLHTHQHHYGQQEHQEQHDEDHGNSISLPKPECQESAGQTCIISSNSLPNSDPETKLSNDTNKKDENVVVDEEGTRKNALVVYPAQCNFSGFKYPLEWVPHLQNGRLECISSLDSFYIEEAEEIINPGTAAGSTSQKRNTYQSSQGTGKPTKCQSPMDGDNPTEGRNTSRPRESNNEHPAVLPKKGNHHKWYVLLDAASYVATNALDLSLYPADFVVLSFYKMFGFPTGLGALIVRNESAQVLKKQYFGGGTVNIQVPSQPFHVKRTNLHERFEDGTIAFLSILAIRNGLDTLSKLCRSMDSIRERTFSLAQYFYKSLSSMSYGNGQRVAKIYSDTEFTSSLQQGPVVTFNLLRSDGGIIGYSEMEQIAYLHDVHLRYGCFCNPGACRRHLGLKTEEVIKQYEAGHVCGDLNDLIDGKPTGAIRASIGYMTTKDNLDFLLRLIYRCWIQPEKFREGANEYFLPVSRPEILSVESTVGTRSSLKKERKLLRIFVYPIKSCAPFEVPKTWAIGPRGLLYDREWLIVNSAGVPLTQKREPRLCQLKPKIDISNRKLVLSIEGFPDVSIPLEINKLQSESENNNSLKTQLCTSKVCGDTVMGLDCGLEVNNWLSDVLGRPGLKLIRMSPDHQRKPKNALDEISLANHSQFLLLSMGSLRRLAHQLIEKGVVSYLIPSWEETLAVEGHGEGNQQEEEQSNGKDQEEAGRLQLEQEMVDVLIDRFRGNFIMGYPNLQDNDAPFEEDTWDEVRIGELLFKSGGPCTRCATICTDQKTGERGPEPLLTLSAMRNGRATFGIHLYNIPTPPPTLGDNPTTTRNSSTTTTSSLLSSFASLPILNAQQSISPSWEEKVHIGTIKTGPGNSRRGGSEDEPLQENGIATVPNGGYSVEKNKTPLEKLHSDDDDGAHTLAPSPAETDFQRSEPMTITPTDQAVSAGTTTPSPSSRKNVPNSGIKLKNQQLSSNSSSESFTLSKSSSEAKLGNSSIPIANQVQTIHIGDPVHATGSDDEKMGTGLVSTTSPTTSSSMTKIHTTSSEPTPTDASGQQQLGLTKNSSSLSRPKPNGTAIHGAADDAFPKKYNSSFTPSGGVKSPIFRELSPIPGDTEMNGGTIQMKTLIESID